VFNGSKNEADFSNYKRREILARLLKGNSTSTTPDPDNPHQSAKITFLDLTYQQPPGNGPIIVHPSPSRPEGAELHVYSKGSGPFGITANGLPSDTWPERFLEWPKGEGTSVLCAKI